MILCGVVNRLHRLYYFSAYNTVKGFSSSRLIVTLASATFVIV